MDGRPRVLVVDDEFGVRESLRAILEGDYDVRLASSGEEALGVLGREPVDVVTVDLRMPGLGGLAVLEHIKQRDPDIEVLIITGNGCFESARQGLRHHAFDYLTKPFDAEHVRRVVQHAVDRRAAVRRLKAGPESLLAELSHEFRTPLNVIVGYSSMLREEGASTLTQEQQLALDRIQANSGTLLGYVETLFYLAELDRGLVPLATSPVRVAAVLGRVRDEQLGRAALVGRPAPAGVALEVRDTGPGMPREVAADLERTAGSDGAAGARCGFGLWLVRRLAHVLGASVRVATGPEGTTVCLGIPDLALSERPPADA